MRVLFKFGKEVHFSLRFNLSFSFIADLVGNLIRKIELFCGSTAFLIGPGQQARMMLDPVRVYATAIYIGCVVLALFCALLVGFIS